nr:phosphate transport regulator [uncultured Aquabacterium sp.]
MLKEKAVEELGQASLLMPAWVKSALAANDRLKLYLTLLQSAWQQARTGKTQGMGFEAELRKAGCPDVAALDGLAERAYLDDDRLIATGLQAIFGSLGQDIELMARPVLAHRDGADPEDIAPLRTRCEHWAKRLAALAQADELGHDALVELTHGDRQRGDSLHLLVMDLHKQVNTLSQSLSTEVIDGAHVWQIRDDDRSLVQAFMRGIAHTARLKFSHPGLDTAVTRDGDVLLIQNDIGTNDAHVLVIQVEGDEVRLTYSDLHRARFDFFRDLLDEVGFSWVVDSPHVTAGLNEGKPYQVGHARFKSSDPTAVCDALESLGARIVFVIDWNRARKRLMLFVSKPVAIALLHSAAREQHGHMGWLLAGGERLVYETMQQFDDKLFRIGERLDITLGEVAAQRFLGQLLRTASEMMQQGLPAAVVADEARLLLSRAVRQRSFEFDLLADHAATIHALAEALDMSLEALLSGADAVDIERIDSRAKEWERRADELLIKARNRLDRRPTRNPFVDMMSHADDVADALEEAHFVLSLIAQTGIVVPAATHAELKSLALATLGAMQDWVRVVEMARHTYMENDALEQEALLKLIWQILYAERHCDVLFRGVRRSLVCERLSDANTLVLLTDLASAMERATDALLRSGHALRNMIIQRSEVFL